MDKLKAEMMMITLTGEQLQSYIILATIGRNNKIKSILNLRDTIRIQQILQLVLNILPRERPGFIIYLKSSVSESISKKLRKSICRVNCRLLENVRVCR